MSDDNRLKTAAWFLLCGMGTSSSALRAVDGVTILCGRRLSLHMMVQPLAAAQFLADPVLRESGPAVTYLVAAPNSLAGTRLYRPTEPEDDAAIDACRLEFFPFLRPRGLSPRAARTNWSRRPSRCRMMPWRFGEHSSTASKGSVPTASICGR